MNHINTAQRSIVDTFSDLLEGLKAFSAAFAVEVLITGFSLVKASQPWPRNSAIASLTDLQNPHCLSVQSCLALPRKCKAR